MTNFQLQTVSHWLAVALYALAAAVFTHAVLFRHPGRLRWGTRTLALGLIPHSAALLLRWAATGHGPYMTRYEVLSSNAWMAAMMLLLFVLWRKRWAAVAMIVLPGIILMMGFGLFSAPEALDLPPTLRSVWLGFHVAFSKLAVGAFLLSAGSAAALLRKSSRSFGRLSERLPPIDVLEAHTIWFVGFGMIFWTTAILAGAIWANQSWGRYWGWDPIETWALVMWLCYGILLHARRFLKLSTKATAWGALACFGVSVLSIFIMPFLVSSLHDSYFR